MTLVVGALNNELAVQVSDRRLTAENGSIVDDESNKLFIFESDACRFIVGFSGLARLSGSGGFETNHWLCEALRDAAPPDFNPDSIILRLKLEAERKFSTTQVRSLAPAARRISIMLTGFVFTTSGPRAAYAMITNYQDYALGTDDIIPWQSFRAIWRIKSDLVSAHQVQRIGLWQLFGSREIEAVDVLLREKRPAAAITGKTVELIRGIADRRESAGTVGKQLMSAVITPTGGANFQYHTDTPVLEYHAPAFIFARSDSGAVIMRDFKLSAANENSESFIYPQQRRDQSCACGSKRKYKQCHGK